MDHFPGIPSHCFSEKQCSRDVLGCSESHDELVHVRVLASNVTRVDADAAFRQNTPSSYEEVAAVAARIPRTA
ncbi:hypothetical protein GU243_17140 [Pseudarthrobacter psychrotolerans]|uniref:Uncharacterized protein n=1 Tax=Pseudarthrobacter psychrotolerans TaxID=2697569 RepID=A0A6P1NW79_9MICC|nr:hypothetical protein [Pseudarthrobacter psychrotolerans]QHK21151.1 hypothetical protein GU243_17140 [Pseudarthrobacter psychrotolerans]